MNDIWTFLYLIQIKEVPFTVISATLVLGSTHFEIAHGIIMIIDRTGTYLHNVQLTFKVL